MTIKHWRAYVGVFLCFCVVLLVSGCAWFSMLKSRDVDCQIDFVRSAGEDFLACMGNFGGTCNHAKGVATLHPLQPVPIFRNQFGMDNGKPAIEGISMVFESPGERFAEKVLRSDTFQKFTDVSNYVRGVDIRYLSKNVKADEKQVPTFEFGRGELQDFVKDVQNATRFNGFSAFNDKLKRNLKHP